MKKNEQKQKLALKPPQFDKKKLGAGIPHNLLLDHEQYQALHLTGANLHTQIAKRISFEEALFSRVNMGQTQLDNLRLEDARLQECDLISAHWLKVGAYRTEFIDCRMTGFLGNEGLFQDVLFQNCQLNLAQFRFSKFRSVRFEDCDLREADFQETDLSHLSLLNCNLENAELSHAVLNGVDFSTCQLTGTRVGIKELKGATISLAQAMALVRALEIKIDFPDEQQ